MSRLNNINNITGVFKRIKADVSDFTDREVIRYTLNLRNRLIEDPPIGTPIDTGWATNNWWFSENGPADSSDKSMGNIDGAWNRVMTDTDTIMALKINGQKLHITNNVPYISRLNNGWSKQTPSGFVDRAILSAGIMTRMNSK